MTAQTPPDDSAPLVLVVDDSKILLHFVKKTLVEAGMRVITTDNPITVPSLIREHNPSLMLVDVEMPGLEGPKVVQIIGDRASMKIFLHSTRPTSELARLVRESGADGYIPKSKDGETLARKLWTVYEQMST